MFKKVLTVAATAALLTVGFGAVAANATVANSSINSWTSGSAGSFRTAHVTVGQSINNTGCVWSTPTGGGQSVSSVQMQFQKSNGAFPAISYGNMTKACGTTMAWGSGLTGDYRYQLNGITDAGGSGYHGTAGTFLFSASSSVINY